MNNTPQYPPLWGDFSLNRHQRRALRSQIDKIHRQRQKGQKYSPKPKRNKIQEAIDLLTKAFAGLVFMGLLQAFIYYDSVAKVVIHS